MSVHARDAAVKNEGIHPVLELSSRVSFRPGCGAQSNVPAMTTLHPPFPQFFSQFFYYLRNLAKWLMTILMESSKNPSSYGGIHLQNPPNYLHSEGT